jgi:hypothetical protein
MQLRADAAHAYGEDSTLIKVHDLFAVFPPYRAVTAIGDLSAEAETGKWLYVNSGFCKRMIHGPRTVRRHRRVINALLHNVLGSALSIEGKRKKSIPFRVKNSPPVR